jgi:hypothetical protein
MNTQMYTHNTCTCTETHTDTNTQSNTLVDVTLILFGTKRPDCYYLFTRTWRGKLVELVTGIDAQLACLPRWLLL